MQHTDQPEMGQREQVPRESAFVPTEQSTKFPFYSGIRFRLGALMFLAAMPAFVLAVYNAYHQHKILVKNAEANALHLTHLIRDEYEQIKNSTRDILTDLSHKISTQEYADEKIKAILIKTLHDHQNYENIGVVRLDGTVKVSGLGKNFQLTFNPSTLRRLKKSNNLVVDEYTIDTESALPTVNLFYPIYNEVGELVSALFAQLNMSLISSAIRGHQEFYGTTVYVIRKDSTLLARYPNPKKWAQQNLSNPAILRTIVSRWKEGTAISTGFNEIKRLYAFSSLDRTEKIPNVFVAVGIPSSLAFAAANQLIFRNVMLVTLAVLIAFILARVASDKLILKSLRPVLNATRRLADGELSVRSRVSNGPNELRELSQSFDQMADSLQVRDREQNQIEQDLRESEERFRSVSACSPSGIMLMDSIGECIYTNSRSREILGAGFVESLGLGWMKSVYTGDLKMVTDEWNECVRDRKAINLDFRIQQKNERIRWVNARSSTVESENRKVDGHVLLIEDITERKHAEDALRQSEESYRNLVETARDPIFTLSETGNIISVNSAFETVTGWPASDWISKPFDNILHTDDLKAAEQALAQVRKGERLSPFELKLKTKSGKFVTTEFTFAPHIRDGQVIYMLGIGRDTTERHRLEEELNQAQKMDAVGRLAGGVAHDFNNILTAITGYCDLSLRRLTPDDPQRRHVEEINKAADRATALTRQLLAFSRKQVLQLKMLDLNHIVIDISKMLRRLIGEDVELKTKLGSSLHRVKADPGKIEQVIVNLAVNARDAMPRGGTLTIETANVTLDESIGSSLSGDAVMLLISDTGTGMTDEVKAHIFEPFFTTKSQGEGTGLGLATSFGIIKQSGGHISVESELNNGTTFRIYFPLVEQIAEVDSPEKPLTQVPTGSEIVLLVEDEPMVRQLNGSVLRELGYNVLEASGGEEALQIASEHSSKRIDLLFTDVIMPQMGGKELADIFRSVYPETKVLFSSGYTEENIISRGALDQGEPFLQKPFSPAGLAAKVREVLDEPALV